jgi:CheY-like chemotaxis protein
MRVLVVDDEADVCKTIALMLTRLGYTCETAASGAEALRKYAEQSFDVVLTDLGMPGMNGLELAEKIQAIKPGARIIIITGWPLQLSPEQRRQCGIEAVLNKPITAKELLSAINPESSDK